MITLATPLSLPSGVVLKNRIAKSATSERLATPDRAPTEGHVRAYATWAAGGAGLNLTGNVMVDRRRLGEPGNVALEDDRDLPAFEAWARAGTANGAQLWMQLNHPGRQAPRPLDPEPVAPSAIGLAGSLGTFARPRALEPAEIEDIVARFATAAALARRAGFGGVQIHAAHGYLVSQFLSPRSNHRTDAWGGNLDGRSRFLREIVAAVRAAVGPGYPISVKLNAADFQKGGFTVDEAVVVAEMLAGIDLLELSGGNYEQAAMFAETAPKESTRKREAFFLDYAERIRERVRTPLMLTGGFRTRAGMAEALASAVDVIGLARPLIVEPDLPARLLAGVADAALPVQLATGIANLDSVITGSWYQVQIDRMARGQQPDPALSRFPAMLRYVRDVAGARSLRLRAA